MKQTLVALDVEGVLVPEIWIALSEKTGIAALRRTTRDEPDYDKLMRGRLAILDAHGIKLSQIQSVIETIVPLEGAPGFLASLRQRLPVILLSDTFVQFAAPLMRQLGLPVLFCNHLLVEGDRITGYQLRQPDQKRQSVRALRQLEYQVIAAGDSYNDTTMLSEADHGIFFRAPSAVRAQFPQFPCAEDHEQLLRLIEERL